MKSITMILVLLLPSLAFAQTELNASIEKGRHYFAGSIDGLTRNASFPSKTYQLTYINTNKFLVSSSSDKLNITPYDTIRFKATLDLIDYNKANDQYKFKLTLQPGIILENSKMHYSQQYTPSGPFQVNADTAKIYFAESGQQSIILQGTFNHEFDHESNPLIHSPTNAPFLVSSNLFNYLAISSQREIPIIVKFNYNESLLLPEQVPMSRK